MTNGAVVERLFLLRLCINTLIDSQCQEQLTTEMNNRSSSRKNRTSAKILCIVCYCYRSESNYSTNYCCSTLTKHSQRRICDTCIHQHILSKLYSCLTSSISCPELNCRGYLNSLVICHILLKHDSQQLLDEYLREQQWHGKSEEWIKRFAIRCPGCQVPIEKNGGCDEMLCIRCQTHFYWSKAKRYADFNEDEKLDFASKQFFSTRCFFLLASFLIIVLLLTYTFSK